MDKLDIALRYDSCKDDEYQAIADFVRDVRSGWTSKIGIGPVGKVYNPKSGVPLTRALQPLAGGGSLRLTYGHQPKSKKFWAWFRFNPSAIRRIEQLEGVFNIMLRHGCGTLMQKGLVRRSDFAVDVDAERYAEYIFIDPAVRHANADYAPVGTVYLGAKLSAVHWRVYDKGKQLAETKGELLQHPRLRIECEWKPLVGPTLVELPTISNPFRRLLVVDRARLAGSTCGALSAIRPCAMEGPGAVEMRYFMLPPKDRKEVADALVGLGPDWWNPSSAWKRLWDAGTPWWHEWAPCTALARDWDTAKVVVSKFGLMP